MKFLTPRTLKSHQGKAILALSLFLGASFAQAQNAPVIFGAAQPISGNSDVWNYGTTTWARFAGISNSPAQTVNGVLFTTGVSTGVAQGAKDVSWNGSTASSVTTFYSNMSQGNLNAASLGSGSLTGEFTTLSSAYQGILGLSAVGATTGVATIGSLTTGRVYAIQAWTNNSVAGSGNYSTTWSSTVSGFSGNSPLIGQFGVATGASAALNGEVGSYMISGFTAASPSQEFDVNCNNALRFTAIQVRDVTGYWSGQAGTGAWDGTSRNFTGGNDSGGVGGMAFNNTAITNVNSVAFADKDGFARDINQNAITVQTAGVSIGTVRFENNVDTYTFTNASGTTGITGATAVVHNGTGRVVFNSANTYTGGTTVNSGTLVVNNTAGTGTGPVTITSSARFEGIGIVKGATTISGTHAPGNSPGTQTFEDGLAYASTSIFEWDLISSTVAGRGTNWDAVNLTTAGTLTVDPAAMFKLVLATGVNFADDFWKTTQTWNVFSATSPTTISSVFQNFQVTGGTGYSPALGSFSMNTGGDLVWNFSAVPEPTSALSGIMLAAGLLRRRR